MWIYITTEQVGILRAGMTAFFQRVNTSPDVPIRDLLIDYMRTVDTVLAAIQLNETPPIIPGLLA